MFNHQFRFLLATDQNCCIRRAFSFHGLSSFKQFSNNSKVRFSSFNFSSEILLTLSKYSFFPSPYSPICLASALISSIISGWERDVLLLSRLDFPSPGLILFFCIELTFYFPHLSFYFRLIYLWKPCWNWNKFLRKAKKKGKNMAFFGFFLRIR